MLASQLFAHPLADEVKALMKHAMDPATFKRLYSNLGEANPLWKKVAGGCNLNRPIDRCLIDDGVALVWLAVGVFAISLIGGDSPALLLPLAPILVALPVIGMRASVDLTASRAARLRPAAIVLVMLSLVGSAGWSLYDYFWRWSDSAPRQASCRFTSGFRRRIPPPRATSPP